MKELFKLRDQCEFWLPSEAYAYLVTGLPHLLIFNNAMYHPMFAYRDAIVAVAEDAQTHMAYMFISQVIFLLFLLVFAPIHFDNYQDIPHGVFILIGAIGFLVYNFYWILTNLHKRKLIAKFIYAFCKMYLEQLDDTAGFKLMREQYRYREYQDFVNYFEQRLRYKFDNIDDLLDEYKVARNDPNQPNFMIYLRRKNP